MKDVISLGKLFSKRIFCVPNYQREYSWEDQQIQEFLEDLDLLEGVRYHYTGTIVLHQESGGLPCKDSQNQSYNTVFVVDGQQRLTTIVILLDGIRRSLSNLSENAKKFSDEIKNDFISYIGINGQPFFKLKLSKNANYFFEKTILSDEPNLEGPKIASEKRLLAAKKQIDDYISGNSSSDREKQEEWLRILYKKITTNLLFSLYEVGNEAEVGIIFEVMNDRGKPLTNLDKVKNFLLNVSTSLDFKNELAKDVNEAWADIFRRLMLADRVSSSDEDRLLRAHWLTFYNPQSRQWNGSKSIKNKFHLKLYRGKHEKLLFHLSHYVKSLRDSCVSFCDAYNPNRDDAFETYKENRSIRAEVIEWSERLNRIGVLATFLPLLIASRKKWPYDPNNYLDILKICEKFAFRVYLAEGYRTYAGQSKLFHLGHELARGECQFEYTISIIKDELAYRCGNEKFNQWTTAENPGNWWYGWSGIKYFLYEYESDLASKRGASPTLAWNDVYNRNRKDTIEHILPQTIENQPYWQHNFKSKKHEEYIHDLGNLTLTKHNSHLQNRSFSEKKGAVGSEKHCYANSSLYVERELTKYENWDADTIDERRARLLEWARQRWAVDLSGIYEEPADDDEEET